MVRQRSRASTAIVLLAMGLLCASAIVGSFYYRAAVEVALIERDERPMAEWCWSETGAPPCTRFTVLRADFDTAAEFIAEVHALQAEFPNNCTCADPGEPQPGG